MVFRRRDKRSWGQFLAHSLWPRGGWGRAAQYVRHRLRRLPDSPERIARGVFAGVVVTFTPFFGLHFIMAAVLAKVMRANILASLLATFFGNPLTFPLIAWACLRMGHFMQGTRYRAQDTENVGRKFGRAISELWHNFMSIFTSEQAHWHFLSKFYHDVLVPYMIGGIVPAVIFGLGSYYMALTVITAYQKRRQITLKRKFEELRAAAATKVTDPAGRTPRAP